MSWAPKVKGESHPMLEASAAVSTVKSRQVSEVKKKKFSKATSASMIPRLSMRLLSLAKA